MDLSGACRRCASYIYICVCVRWLVHRYSVQYNRQILTKAFSDVNVVEGKVFLKDVNFYILK